MLELMMDTGVDNDVDFGGRCFEVGLDVVVIDN